MRHLDIFAPRPEPTPDNVTAAQQATKDTMISVLVKVYTRRMQAAIAADTEKAEAA